MNAPLWTSDEAAAVTGGAATRPWQAEGVSLDSRTIRDSDLFVAVDGPRFDGHNFVTRALAKGASAAMVNRIPADTDDNAPLLLVEDTQKGLEALGRGARARATEARIIAVTGSVGKTGTKEALKLALSPLGPCTASASSLNNHWGVPLSLARMAADTRYGVFEVGMNHAGEIGPLSRMIRPHVAIITTVEMAHTEFLGSVEAVADAKSEIFEGVEPGGAAVLNRDSPYFDRLAAAARAAGIDRIVGFGHDAAAEARAMSVSRQPDHSEIRASILGRSITYRVGVPGPHWVMNSLAVLAAAAAAGADPTAAAAGLASMTAMAGRGKRHQVRLARGSFTVIDESYNANPASMRAAIEVLAGARPGPSGRRIAVLGDMRELGPDSSRLHAALAEPLREGGIDTVFTGGEQMVHLHAALPSGMRGGHEASSDVLAGQVCAAVRPGDVVMVKGSLASRMSHVVEALLELDGAPQCAVGG